MEVYRVIKEFQWFGWLLAPEGECHCGCGDEYSERCTGQIGTGCPCADQKRQSMCHCRCGINPALYGGELWFVDEGNARKEMILASRYAIYDASLASVEELMKDEKYSRLLKAPSKRYLTEAAKTPVAAGS